MAYDLPGNFTNMNNESVAVDGVGSLFQYAHYATGDAFGLGLTAIIFLIAFGATAIMNIGRAFASASFITLVFSVYFVRIGLLNEAAPFVLLIMSIAGFFWAKSERSASY